MGFDVASAGGIKLIDGSFDTAHKCSSIWTMLTF
jgi:hypothetical protein